MKRFWFILILAGFCSASLVLADIHNKPCTSFYVVQKHDCLSCILRANGVEEPYKTAIKIAKLNNIKNPDVILPGQKICLGWLPTKEYKAPEPVASPVKPTPVVTPEPVEKPTPMPEPKPAPKQEAAETEESFTGLSLSPYLLYSKIDSEQISNGAKGGALSKVDYGVEFKISQIWEDCFNTELIIQAERRKYKDVAGRTFIKNDGSLINFGAGLGLRFWKRFETKLKVLYGDELYFRAPSLTTLSIDSTKAIKADLALNFDIARSKRNITGIGLGVRAINGGLIETSDSVSYNAKTGYGYFASLYLKQKLSSVMFEESFTYEDIRKNTDLFKQKHSAMYLKFGASYLF